MLGVLPTPSNYPVRAHQFLDYEKESYHGKPAFVLKVLLHPGICPVGGLPDKLLELFAGGALGRESRDVNWFIIWCRKPKECKTKLRGQMPSYYLSIDITLTLLK